MEGQWPGSFVHQRPDRKRGVQPGHPLFSCLSELFVAIENDRGGRLVGTTSKSFKTPREKLKQVPVPRPLAAVMGSLPSRQRLPVPEGEPEEESALRTWGSLCPSLELRFLSGTLFAPP